MLHTSLRRFSFACVLLLLGVDPPLQASPVPPNSDRPNASTTSRRIEIRGLDPLGNQKLRGALRLATRRLQDQEACGDLFRETGRSGTTAISTMDFDLQSGAVCRRGVAATTTVGGSVTRLCRDWLPRLDRHELATLLIHEALHQAGMSEWPHDPDGMRSQEINDMVSKSCGL